MYVKISNFRGRKDEVPARSSHHINAKFKNFKINSWIKFAEFSKPATVPSAQKIKRKNKFKKI